MLKLIGAESREAADQFSVLSKDDQAIFAHGFWLQHDEMLARTYVGLVTGWGRHEVRSPLLGALKHERTMMKRVDRTFGERLGTPDTLHIREARERLDLILDDDKQDPYALTADALLALEAGLLAEGEIYAKKALEQAPKLADAHNAIGLSQIGRKNWKEARSRFARASEADPDWRTPWLNTELAEFISGKGDEMEELARIQRAAIQDLSHPEVYYMGARLLERHKRLEESADAYARQIEVNPAHARARFDLGRVYFKLGEIEKATLNWRELMEALPEFRSICIYPLLDAYLASGETGKAQTVIAEELRTLSPEARARVEDISLVASPEDVVKLGRLPEESQPQFVRAFWQRLDPTPATPGNERLVEHHRRVIYAMQNFSMDGETWDRRGDVYIRYGEPRHISKRSDIRFETDREVVRVKDRLQTSLTPEAKEEIIARAGRYRTSARDIVIAGSNAERVEGNDFESIDFEMNPNRSFFVSSDDQGPQYVRGTEDLTQRGKTREHLIRGIPLFPVDGSTPWEYWIYPDVAGGIEVVFTSPIKEQNFEFPGVTMGRKISEFNQMLWNDRRPDIVFARAKSSQPSRYDRPGQSLDLHHHSADYRGRQDRSRLEVYFGVPVQEMTKGGADSNVFERGIALFDSSWTPIYRKLEPVTFVTGNAEVDAGTLAIDEVVLQVPPGKYFLGVQVNHPATNRRSGQTMEVVVEDYAVEGLMVSDIEMAGSVVTDSTATIKGGLRVVSMPSRTYKVGQPVLLYYEVYGLSRDAFGQTRHRVDYRISPRQGKLTAVRVLRALGRLLGIEEKSIVTISYERSGTEPNEHNYLEIDPGESKEGLYELTVTVTDLTTEQVAAKSSSFLIGK